MRLHDSNFPPYFVENSPHKTFDSSGKDNYSGYVEIKVSDTGTGIPGEELAYVFDRFYQASSSTDRERRGTGIGLALVKELVELHHGEVFVQSTEGKGSEFTVRLPLGKDHLQPEEIIAEPQTASGGPTTWGGDKKGGFFEKSPPSTPQKTFVDFEDETQFQEEKEADVEDL